MESKKKEEKKPVGLHLSEQAKRFGAPAFKVYKAKEEGEIITSSTAEKIKEDIIVEAAKEPVVDKPIIKEPVEKKIEAIKNPVKKAVKKRQPKKKN